MEINICQRLAMPLRKHAPSTLLTLACLCFSAAAPLYAAADTSISSARSPYPTIVVPAVELEQVRAAAEAGDAMAQVRLAHHYMTHYEEGYANEQKAGELFRKAAESGNAQGQAWYSVYLWVTVPGGEKAMLAAATPWAEKAAEQGNTIGEYMMGKCTRTERDSAIDWFRRAAKKGFMPAQRDLAYLLLEGNYFEDVKNPEVKEAHKLIARAVKKRDCVAMMMAGGHPHRSTMNTNEHKWEHPVKKSEKFVRQAIKRSQTVEWCWYGSVFHRPISTGRSLDFGGFDNMMVLYAYKDLYTLYRFGRRHDEAARVPGQLIATLKRRAKTDPVRANLCLAALFKYWKTLYFPNESCPEDYKIYAAKAAQAESDHYDAPRMRKIAETF